MPRPHYAGEILIPNNQWLFDLCLRTYSVREIKLLSRCHRFLKSSFFDMFSVHMKTKTRRFQIPPV